MGDIIRMLAPYIPAVIATIGAFLLFAVNRRTTRSGSFALATASFVVFAVFSFVGMCAGFGVAFGGLSGSWGADLAASLVYWGCITVAGIAALPVANFKDAHGHLGVQKLFTAVVVVFLIAMLVPAFVYAYTDYRRDLPPTSRPERWFD